MSFQSFRLDFYACASVCVDIKHERIWDDISNGFAGLTAMLKNTAALANKGQSRRCTVEDLENLAAHIRLEVHQISGFWRRRIGWFRIARVTGGFP